MSDGQNGLPPGIDPQALQAAFAAQQQQQHQQQQGGAGGMTGMNPAMFQQLQQLQMQQQQQQQQLQAQQGGGMGGGMAGTGFQQGSMPSSDGNNGMMTGQQQQPPATNQSGGPGQMSLPAGLQSSQDAIQMLQRLRLNMQNLQSQWAQLSNAPESPQKAEQQQRLAGEMRKMKGLHDQLFEMLKNQASQQQQQQQPRGGQQQQSNQHAGSPAPPSQQQQQSQQSNEGQGPQQHLPGQQQQQGQSQQQQQQQQQQQPQASSSQQQGGFPSENPQHQAQLAVLQAFAQQQQQRQQQESGRPTTSSGSQQASGSMGPPAGPVAGQQQPGFSSNGPSVAPSSQQQQQQQGPPQPLPIQSIPGLASSSQFLNTINSFMNQRGTPFPGGTSFGFVAPASQATHGETKTIELNALFATVMGLGGSTRLSSAAPPTQAPNQYTVSKGLMGWIILANRLGLAVAGADPNGEGNRDEIPTPAQTAERLKNWYSERLGPFEEWWTSKVKAQQQAQQQRQQQQQQQQQSQPPPQQPQQQPSQGPEGQQQLGQPGPSGSTPAPGASQPPPGPMQQGLQQLATQLSRLVNDGQMSAQEARDRFAQAQQRAAAEFAASSSDPSGQQQQQQQPGMMGNNAQPGYPTPDRRASQMQQPGMGGPQAAVSPAVAASPAPDAEGPKSKKRARKPTITKGNGKAPKTEKDGTPGAQDRHIRQTSSQASQPPPNPLGDGGQQTGSLSPRTALRMLQHGNLNPAQHAAALAVVRANSGSAGTMPSQQHPQQPPYDQRSQQQQQGYGEGPAAYAVPPMSQGPAPAPVKEEEPDHPPNKFKIEYIPTQREIHTYGGWDLGMIDEGVGHIARGFARQARTVDELGVVDIGALILSIRSRLEIEVSYALNTLLILSSGSGTATDRYGITLAHCGELLDELVELLQESALMPADEAGVATSHADTASFTVNGKPTHCDWIVDVLSEETEARLKRRTRATARSRSVPLEAKTIQIGEPEALSEGAARTATPEPVARVSVDDDDDDEQSSPRTSDSKQGRQATIALVVLDVLRNFASMPANVPMLASHKDLLLLLSRLVARDEALAAMADEDEQSQLAPTVFSKTELLRVKKDVLFMLSCLASPYMELKYLPRSTVLSFFDLMSPFIVDSSKIQDLAGFTYMDQPLPPGVPPHLAPRLPPIPWSHRVPHYADLALDALSRFAQPDDNRRVISKLIPEDTLLQLIQHLSRMLPYSELDFTLFRTEARLGYTERIAMCLYNLIFLSSSKAKLKLRNSSAGWASSIFRVVKRTAKQGIQQQHQGHQHGPGQGGRSGSLEFGSNPFSCLIYRLIETLTIVDESRDLLDEKVLLSFSMEDQPGGGGSSPPASYRHQQQRGLRHNVNAAEEERGSAAVNGNSKRRAPLLAAEEWDVLGLLSMPGFDPTLASQLTSMLAG